MSSCIVTGNDVELFKRATIVLNSVSNALMWMSLCVGIRPSCRITIDENQYNRMKKLCDDAGISVCHSRYKYLLNSSGATRSRRARASGEKVSIRSARRGAIRAYVAHGRADAAELCDIDDAKQREDSKEAEILGRRLGYPPCCSEFWVRNCLQENLDPVIPAIGGVKSYPFYNNIILRELDCFLISHYPCSGDCVKSAKMGKRNLELLNALRPSYVKHFTHMLKTLVVYTKGEGIFYFTDYKRSGRRVTFKRFGSIGPDSLLYGLFRKEGAFTIHGAKHIAVAGRTFDKGVGVILYR